VRHQPANGADDVVVVGPPDVPAPPGGRAAEAALHERQQRVEDLVAVEAHDHRRADRHLADLRRLRLAEGALPDAREVDAEAPRVGRAGS
jgi:hypothetical protein